ncbi:ATP-dependent RNA helicase DbpA [Photobacterium sp. MCCC 1A19761]|uniref:ATP-dependent RNA helicase DbpA n=1 Tax=Photobacterium sp. MCCC 1A19761 TaxID=3115000 RepID=UPI00307E6212
MSQTDFSTLDLKPDLLNNLASLGYDTMTPIQAQSLPHILAGKDVIAQGKTGSGKTAAFGLGVLEHLDVKRFRVQSLVLCPTRELADQVAKEIRRLARAIHNIKVLTLCGGMPFGPQIGSLEHGAHIIVGTPGRVEEHVRKGYLNLDHLNLLVLDEADRMLEMGFQDSLDAIIDAAPARRQGLLFSATYPTQIQAIASRILEKPVTVKVASTHDQQSIRQHFFKVDSNDDRMMAVRLLLAYHCPDSAVIFCNTKREVQDVADELNAYGFSALALHGDLEQRERDQTLVRFANKSASVLVATDVAARGLDIDALDAVINYHLARDVEVHVHRIGRTGRAGSKGIACSLFSDKEHYKVALLEDYLEQPIEGEALPSSQWLAEPSAQPAMITLQISGGKKQKVRPGDILGALTGEQGIEGSQVGKINVFDQCAYVAVQRDVARRALKKLEKGKMKGRTFRVRQIRD